MGFSEKAKDIFFVQKGLNNKKLAKKLGNYNESLVSRHMNSDELSGAFIKLIAKYFPDVDLNYLLCDTINSPDEKPVFNTRQVELVEEIEVRLKELKKIVSPK